MRSMNNGRLLVIRKINVGFGMLGSLDINASLPTLLVKETPRHLINYNVFYRSLPFLFIVPMTTAFIQRTYREKNTSSASGIHKG